jgi:hypothetical protein
LLRKRDEIPPLLSLIQEKNSLSLSKGLKPLFQFKKPPQKPLKIPKTQRIQEVFNH